MPAKMELISALFLTDRDSEVAFVVLITSPVLAGLLLLFLLFVALRLMDREREDLSLREVYAYQDFARLAATGILLSLSATVAGFGWVNDWWGVIEVAATLYIASLVAVAGLTAFVLKRSGAI